MYSEFKTAKGNYVNTPYSGVNPIDTLYELDTKVTIHKILFLNYILITMCTKIF